MAPDNAEISTQKLFLPPGTNLQQGDPDLTQIVSLSKHTLISRWKSAEGRDILRRWQESGFNRKTLESLVGKYYDHIDLRGIDLSGSDLSAGIDLTKVDFFAANLSKANFRQARLRDSWLSESNLKGARFDWAELDQARVDNVEFDYKTSFVGVNLNAINFTLAALLQDLALSQQRIANLEQTHRNAAAFLRITSDYGRSFTRLFAWSGLVIGIFSLLYCFVPQAAGRNGASINLLESVYFSFVVFTTLGFGDITPGSPVGMALVIVEVILGYVMLGLLVGIISRRVVAP